MAGSSLRHTRNRPGQQRTQNRTINQGPSGTAPSPPSRRLCAVAAPIPVDSVRTHLSGRGQPPSNSDSRPQADSPTRVRPLPAQHATGTQSRCGTNRGTHPQSLTSTQFTMGWARDSPSVTEPGTGRDSTAWSEIVITSAGVLLSVGYAFRRVVGRSAA